MKRGAFDNKVAQVSIFIIIAIMLVVGVGFLYSIKIKNDSEKSSAYFSSVEIKPKLDLINDKIQECYKNSAQISLEGIAIQGGYYLEPKNYIDVNFSFIPYYYYNGEVIYPDKSEIEKELSLAFNDELYYCLKEINNSDFVLMFKKPMISTQINEKTIDFNVIMPIIIKKEDYFIVIDLKEFSPLQIDSKLSDIISLADYIADSNKNDSIMLCASCIANLAEEKDLYVDSLDISSSDTLIAITENTSYYPLTFMFANKYKEEKLERFEYNLTE